MMDCGQTDSWKFEVSTARQIHFKELAHFTGNTGKFLTVLAPAS